MINFIIVKRKKRPQQKNVWFLLVSLIEIWHFRNSPWTSWACEKTFEICDLWKPATEVTRTKTTICCAVFFFFSSSTAPHNHNSIQAWSLCQNAVWCALLNASCWIPMIQNRLVHIRFFSFLMCFFSFLFFFSIAHLQLPQTQQQVFFLLLCCFFLLLLLK